MAALLPFKVPEISAADFSAFHEAHFSNLSTGHFESHFLRPDESVVASVGAATAGDNANAEAGDEYYYDEEGYYEEDDYDDGLGYYPDGVKRTLTDEQIAIFRHSELEAMRRVRESAKIKKVMDPAADGVAVVIEGAIGEQLSEGEVDSSTNKARAGPSQQQQQRKQNNGNGSGNGNNKKNKNKRRGGKKNNHNRPEGGGEQIDLRKRTWDVVDKGLASLDYGEEEHGQPSGERAVQRRRISYDD
ncbi:hypothetical protein B0T20DRAFT_480035 [Sordaria brevicollis]|uniref:Uncharacterized protein n=1 Tax=Sordaria brevicollis TaxID=83679 RepID=A0AAE0PD76_SORBR|nr:hypothetical protein B0T20DRAFT_480035 [Sordaria brevicollis]